ncbi:Dcp1p-Dcp2p decapping enzyme complex alpha subunit [Coemansia sp. Benny D115]|nr:Dcp1p-Dcp2p decapping enzyme complex alpha subunit [Coemansia sp. Benny D115]
MGVQIPQIPGTLASAEKSNELRGEIQALLGMATRSFPGSQPVSFTKLQSLPELLNNDYLLCEKSDGVRVLVYITSQPEDPSAPAASGQNTYLITRKNEYFSVPGLLFPLPDGQNLHNQTLVDAELVVDLEEDGSKTQRMLVFDALAINGLDCMQKDLETRLRYAKEQLIDPLAKLQSADATLKQTPSQLPFIVELKQFFRSYAVGYVQNHVIPQLKHQSDGLIFTAVHAPYTSGTCDKIIKWKPACENSVDFKIHSCRNKNNKPFVGVFIWEGGLNYSFFGGLAIRPSDWYRHFANKDTNGRIVEAIFDPEFLPPCKWRFMRFRDDKHNGNYKTVVERILQSIHDNISLEKLLENMKQAEINWKERGGSTATPDPPIIR